MARKNKGGITEEQLYNGASFATTGGQALLGLSKSGAAGAANTVLGPAGFLLQVKAGDAALTAEQQAFAENINMSPVRFKQAALFNTAIREKLARLEEQRVHNVGNAAVSTAAGTVGAVAGQIAIPIPFVGAAVGGIGSTILASMFYDAVLVGADPTMAKLATDINEGNRELTEEAVLVMIASKSPETKNKILTATKSKTLLEALDKGAITPDYMEHLREEMRLVTNAERDTPIGDSRSAVQQVTQLVKQGKMNVMDILVPDALMNDKFATAINEMNEEIMAGQRMASAGVVHSGGERDIEERAADHHRRNARDPRTKKGPTVTT
jgi:hypothetical protein